MIAGNLAYWRLMFMHINSCFSNLTLRLVIGQLGVMEAGSNYDARVCFRDITSSGEAKSTIGVCLLLNLRLFLVY